MSTTEHVPFAATLHVRDSCLCLHAQRAARALARRFDDALRPIGLTNGQFSLMMALNRPDRPSMAAIAKLLAMDRTTLTAALKPLERRGLIFAALDAADRRARRLELTTSGHALLLRALPVWQHLHTEIDASLPAADRDRLRRLLLALS